MLQSICYLIVFFEFCLCLLSGVGGFDCLVCWVYVCEFDDFIEWFGEGDLLMIIGLGILSDVEW